MEVFITCPSQRDRNAVAGMSGYNFHLLDAPLNPRTPSPDLNLLAYIDECREYIRTHHIDAIFYSRDVADLVAAALCEEFGFPGPSVESVFLCMHKYYGRRAEPNPIVCEAIDLNDPAPTVSGYPCFLKPPWLNLGILGFALESPHDLAQALEVARRGISGLVSALHAFFPALCRSRQISACCARYDAGRRVYRRSASDG